MILIVQIIRSHNPLYEQLYAQLYIYNGLMKSFEKICSFER